MSADRMTFGRHKGRLLSELPTKYLKWYVEQITDRALYDRVAELLRNRGVRLPPLPTAAEVRDRLRRDESAYRRTRTVQALKLLPEAEQTEVIEEFFSELKTLIHS